MLVWCCFLSRSSNLNLDKRVSSWNLGCSLYTLTIVILGLDGHVHDSAWSANTASLSKDMHELSQNLEGRASMHSTPAMRHFEHPSAIRNNMPCDFWWSLDSDFSWFPLDRCARPHTK